MFRTALPSALAVALAAVVLGGALLAPTPAEARGTRVKFSVVEYRITQVPRETELSSGERITIMETEMSIKGRASAFGDSIEFKWDVRDADRWIPLLQLCPGGRLNGEVEYDDDIERGAREIEGRGPLLELRCRQILK